jgi:hypothetical protein
MRPLWYSINVTLDGRCDHRVMLPDEDLFRHAADPGFYQFPNNLSLEFGKD